MYHISLMNNGMKKLVNWEVTIIIYEKGLNMVLIIIRMSVE